MTIINAFKEPFRKSQLKSKRKDLENKDFSIISSNCNGGCILHDLGMRFNSPFVNLWIKPQDFLKLLKDIHHYLSCDIVFTKEEGINYPIGLLDDVRIYFQHYKTEQEAKSKWMDRVKRINYSNLFVMFSDRDGCTESDLKEFDQMSYKTKWPLFTNHILPLNLHSTLKDLRKRSLLEYSRAIRAFSRWKSTTMISTMSDGSIPTLRFDSDVL